MSDLTDNTEEEVPVLPEGAKGVSANSGESLIKVTPKKINTTIYWRCICGAGAPLGVEACEACGQPPRYK